MLRTSGHRSQQTTGNEESVISIRSRIAKNTDRRGNNGSPFFNRNCPFGGVIDKGGAPYNADIRGVLKGYAETLNKK